jgi:hypothetical protein
LTLPKPLIVVIVIILVIALVSCGASAFRSINGEPHGNNSDSRASLKDNPIAKFLKNFAPPTEPVGFPPATTDCTQGSSTLTVSGSCSVTIPSSANKPRREMLLSPTNLPMSMKVAVTRPIDDFPFTKTEASDDETIGVNSDDGSVIVQNDQSAVITLSCSSTCTVAVNPPH